MCDKLIESKLKEHPTNNKVPMPRLEFRVGL